MVNKSYAIRIASAIAVLKILEAVLQEAQDDILDDLVANEKITRGQSEIVSKNRFALGCTDNSIVAEPH